RETKLEFDLLHKKDMSPIRYAKVCRLEGDEVPNEEIVKGYEYADGEYVILEKDDFLRANAKLTRSIEIMSFADETEIDDIYFEKPYYLEPDRGGAKAYGLLRDALKQTGKVGIAQFLLRDRAHLAAVKPSGDVLVLNQLRYKSELRESEGLKLPEAASEDKEMELAVVLIDRLSEPFRPEQYKDTYTEQLRATIEERAKGRVPAALVEEPQPTAVADLMASLKKSIEKEEAKAA
ncbi:MAG: Ku protein, partial [Armatimonadetes bacterium]|nr:Ku protein [Armatimonadota bacterium]